MNGLKAIGVAALLLGAGMAQGAGTAVVGGTVYDMVGDHSPRQGATVLIRDGRIEAVGPDLDIPAGYSRVDAAGRVVTPGLIESHSQFGLVEIGTEITTMDGIISEYPSGPSFDVRYALNDASVAIAINRRDGITRAIAAPRAGNDPLAGMGVAVRLTPSELLTATDAGMFGSVGAGSAGFVGGSRSAVIQRLQRGFSLARSYNPGRYVPGPGDYSHQDMAALKRFLASDAPLVLDVHRAAEIRQVMRLAADNRLNLIVLGGSEAWKVAAELAAAQIPVVVNVLSNLPLNYDRLGARFDNAAILEQAGVPVLLSTGSTLNARTLRQVAGNAVAHGMSRAAALAAITSLPGRSWPFPDGTGTFTSGAPADLVIWSADPLELTSWAEQVMIEGAWQDMSSRQTRLFERYRNLDDADRYYR